MHGLINKTLQCFVEDTYGPERWAGVVRRGKLDPPGFEAMLSYDDRITGELVAAISAELGRPPEAVFEDVGTYLVSHPDRQAVRRLLRFSGRDFRDFLHALDDLPDRIRLAVPDIDLPRIELCDLGEVTFTISCQSLFPGAGSVLVGVLRAMADDFGALVTLERRAEGEGRDVIEVHLVEDAFTEGRAFDLADRQRYAS